MNDLINATLAWLLDSLMIIIGFTGVPGNLLDGLFNDVLLAFQLFQNYNRRLDLGPYGYPEMMFPTGAGAYTLDAFFSGKSAMWDTRGYRSAQATFENKYPYALGRDVFPGALMSIAQLDYGELYTDYIENAILKKDRNTAGTLQVLIGDGKAEEAPVTKIQRKINGLQEFVNIVTMAPN